jgi:arylsulfatase A-like enzyme
VLTGAFVGLLAGALDGLYAWRQSPRGELGSRELASLLVIAASLLGTALALLGALHALLARAVFARGALRTAWRYLQAGPRRWFQRDERAALRVGMALVGAFTAGGVGYHLALGVVRSVRTPTLAALSLVALALVALLVGAFVALVVALALEPLLRRSRRLASPGAVSALAAAGGLLVVGFLVLLTRAALARVHFAPMVAVFAMGAGYVSVGRGLSQRFSRSPRAAALAMLALALVGFAWSGHTLGRSQPLLLALTDRTLVVGRLVPWLQHWSDFDGDGHGRWFGGGDCDDHDRRIHPLARDVPGNGRDENCSGFDAQPLPDERTTAFVRPATSRPSIVLLSIDTVRPDHTSLYGYHRPTTPTLDGLFAQGARFDRAYTVAPQTVRSFAGVFSGRIPTSLCWGRDPRFPPLRDPNELLAEVLRDAGYDTAVFTNTSYFALTAGFFQGFDTVEQGDGFKDDARVATWRARLWLERAARVPRPFFAWIHLVDPHEPYTDRTEPNDFGHEPVDRYDEEIAWADHTLASIRSTLEALAASRPLLLVAMSDHGEAFGEHGVNYHSYDAHEEALRVMLAVRGPGVLPGPRTQLVSLLDVHATLLAYIDRTPPSRAPSRSLIPLLQSPPGAVIPWRSAVFAEVGNEREFATAVVAPPWKLIHDANRGAWELYNLDRDPGERRNVYNREPAVAEQLRARLADFARPQPGRCTVR